MGVQDVASYLVVRTLGTDSAHRLDAHDVDAARDDAADPKRRDTASEEQPPPPLPHSQSPRKDHHHHHHGNGNDDSDNGFTIVIPPRPDASASASASGEESPAETYYATSSDANFALAGEGIFSPPGSRPASPPTLRNPRAAPPAPRAPTFTFGADAPAMRKRA